MAASKKPFALILSLAFVGALVCVVIRFAYLAFVLIAAGESLESVPLKTLLIEVMELQYYALIGAGVGAILALIIAIIDMLRSSPREDLKWRTEELDRPFADDTVKAKRMQVGEDYLDHRGDETPDADG
jgi:hypothetical protein